MRSPLRSPMRATAALELPRSRSASPNPVPLAPNTEELVRLLVETEMDAHQAAIQVAALQEALKVFREVRLWSLRLLLVLSFMLSIMVFCNFKAITRVSETILLLIHFG